ncbi:E2F transcription factor-like E2FE isoform X2 [Tasmannia lanceolata]|uniref:E2F transcription factor-like E2FE isoform X2 n=1 Tax=Tasmannia lanceolata TaxID=3420 RepID=UPI004063FC61
MTSFRESGSRHHTYSRKQKSLGLLCSNFLSLYNRDDVESVGLDEAASRLGVERRRIYDIVNVLESVGVLARKAKNQYSWKGFSGMPQALEELRKEALREKSCNATVQSCDKSVVLEDEEEEEEEKLFNQNSKSRQDKSSTDSVLFKDSLSCSSSSKIKTDNRREKSLGLLTQNFVKLFLSTNADMVSLDEAAKFLLGDCHSSLQIRTKVRRLYDIANVLSSMNLIEKTHHTETRKPAFRWLGINGKSKHAISSSKSPNAKQPNKREFGTDITNTEFKKSKVSVDEEEPSKMQIKSKAKSDHNQTEQQQSSKGYVYGPFSPVSLLDVVDTEKGVKKVQDWETMASSFRLHYHNQALSELFSHYMDAWKSWYIEVGQGNRHHP